MNESYFEDDEDDDLDRSDLAGLMQMSWDYAGGFRLVWDMLTGAWYFEETETPEDSQVTTETG